MAITAHYPHQSSSPRALAMAMALVSALVLSPLYTDHSKSESSFTTRWSSSGLMLPAVVAVLIVAIKTTTSSSKAVQRSGDNSVPSDDNAALVFRIGSSSWGLAGILIMLLFVTSWQTSVQHLFWK